jgi:hypothetical protein
MVINTRYNIGDKVSATVKEKSKTKYHFYGGIQCGDLYDCETRVIHPAFDIMGVIAVRIKKTGGKVKIVQTADGKSYRLDRLTNIQHL